MTRPSLRATRLSVGLAVTAFAIGTAASVERIVDNVTLTLSESGFSDNSYVTGTGVDFSVSAGGGLIADAPMTWNYVELLELTANLPTGEVQIYPRTDMGDSSARASLFNRLMRADTTQWVNKANGDPPTADFSANFRLRYGFFMPPSFTWTDLRPASDIITVNLTVQPVVVNSLLLNATTHGAPGGPPTGWATVTETEATSWAGVSPEMAAAARTAITNHQALAGDTHLKPVLVGQTSAPGLLSQATAWFNSSHGYSTGVTDDSDPLQQLTWQEISNCLGSSNISSQLPLQLNMAFLYCCKCGSYSGLQSALFGATAVNQAAFAFSESVLATLKSGDSTQYLAYNSSDGTITMTDKLTLHAQALLNRLMGGDTAQAALSEANNLYPPRAFDHSDPLTHKVNVTRLMNMNLKGDANARLKTVYRPEATDRYVMPNDALIILKPQQGVPTP